MGRVLLAGLSDNEIRELYRGIQHARSDAKAPDSLAALLKQANADRAGKAVVQNTVYEPWVASVAAPILDMTDRVVAAVNISAVALLTNDAELNGPLRTDVIAAADAISRDLGRQERGERQSTR